MSQHHYITAKGKCVQAGYDRQLRDFFFNFYAKRKNFPLNPAETSLDGTVDSRNLNSIKQRVLMLEPTVPEQMWLSIQEDADNNVGNRLVYWNPDGTIAKEHNPERAHAAG